MMAVGCMVFAKNVEYLLDNFIAMRIVKPPNPTLFHTMEDGIEDPNADVILVETRIVESLNQHAHMVMAWPGAYVFYQNLFYRIGQAERRHPEKIIVETGRSVPLLSYYILGLASGFENFTAGLRHPPPF